jgi:hypothetical protein
VSEERRIGTPTSAPARSGREAIGLNTCPLRGYCNEWPQRDRGSAYAIDNDGLALAVVPSLTGRQLTPARPAIITQTKKMPTIRARATHSGRRPEGARRSRSSISSCICAFANGSLLNRARAPTAPHQSMRRPTTRNSNESFGTLDDEADRNSSRLLKRAAPPSKRRPTVTSANRTLARAKAI